MRKAIYDIVSNFLLYIKSDYKFETEDYLQQIAIRDFHWHRS